MAVVVKCSECGGAVSVKAPACPHCGAPRKAASGGISPWTIIGWLVLGFFLLMMYSCYQVFKSGGPMGNRGAGATSAPAALPDHELTILSVKCEEAGDDTRVEIAVRNTGATTIEVPKVYFRFNAAMEDSLFDPVTIPPGSMATAFARHRGEADCSVMNAQDRDGAPIHLTHAAQ